MFTFKSIVSGFVAGLAVFAVSSTNSFAYGFKTTTTTGYTMGLAQYNCTNVAQGQVGSCYRAMANLYSCQCFVEDQDRDHGDYRDRDGDYGRDSDYGRDGRDRYDHNDWDRRDSRSCTNRPTSSINIGLAAFNCTNVAQGNVGQCYQAAKNLASCECIVCDR